jgi:hypothetical protein
MMHIFSAYKTTVTTHHCPKLIIRRSGVDRQITFKNFGGPNNYLFSAEIKNS